jgi:P4 family phage/plasmid primase-like protien
MDDDPESRNRPSGTRTFKQLLDLYRTRPGEIYTHTGLGDSAGTYNVPGSQYDDFLKKYCEAVEDGEIWHLTERACEKYPLLVDLDFKFPAPADGQPVARQYDGDFVRAVVMEYVKVLRGMMATAATSNTDKRGDVVTETIMCHVMQRDAPYESKGETKDGLHLVFSNVILSAMAQRVVRQRVLPGIDALLERLRPAGMTVDVDKVVDDCTSGPKGGLWMLHGSCKPGRKPYKETHILKIAPSGEVVTQEIDDDMLWSTKRLSVRIGRIPTALKETTYDELAEREKQARDNRRIETRNKNSEFQDHLNKTTVVSSAEEVALARKLVDLLSVTRAHDYKSWIEVGFALRNIDDSLLDAWDAFSRKSPKYDGSCGSHWPYYKNDGGLKLGSLRRWAKEDSPEQYEEIERERNNYLVTVALKSKTHFDVAQVVKEEYGGQYVCVAAGGEGTWYRFRDHRWRKMAKAVELRTALSTTIHDIFKTTTKKLVAASEDDMTKTSKLGDDMCKELKQGGFKGAVMREAADLFYEDDFVGKLDSNVDLLCFENGVYDLEKGEFRDGKPEDMVSLSTGHDYVDVPADAPEMAEIMAFFASVFPNEGVRKYFLSKMAIYLWGKNPEDEFMILTGSGSNGKSKTIELLQHALGEYAVNLPTALMTQKRNASNAASPEVARLKGKRLAVMQEPSDTDSLNISILKESSGSDMMQARPLYGEPFEFKPQFSMIMTCNTLPKVPDTDGGTWRRIKVVEFVSKFTSKPDPEDPLHFPIDLHLGEKFPRWRPALVCMLLRLYAEAKANKHKINVPYEVTLAGDNYLAEQDEMSQWKLECIEKDDGAELTISEALATFKAWARKLQLHKDKQRMTPNNFEKKMLSCLGKPKIVDDRKFWPGWREREDTGFEH